MTSLSTEGHLLYIASLPFGFTITMFILIRKLCSSSFPGLNVTFMEIADLESSDLLTSVTLDNVII